MSCQGLVFFYAPPSLLKAWGALRRFQAQRERERERTPFELELTFFMSSEPCATGVAVAHGSAAGGQ